MDMYSAACKEAQLAKQKASELQRWKTNELQKHEEAKLSEEAALAIAEQEKIKCRAAIEAAEAAQRIAELESQKAKDAEMKTTKEIEDRKRVMSVIAQGEVKYRRYTMDDIQTATANFSDSLKIGEGGYGPVFKCYYDNAMGVLVTLEDASKGFSEYVNTTLAHLHPIQCTRQRKVEVEYDMTTIPAFLVVAAILFAVLRPRRPKPKIN